MKQRKRYELDWHSRTIRVYIEGAFSHEISFTEALSYQRDIIAKLLRSLDNNGFELTGHTSEKAWVYEGMI